MKEFSNQAALTYLGSRYVKVPRAVWDDLSSSDISVHLSAKVYYTLFMECEYVEKTLEINNQQVVCHVGEVITTYKALAHLTDMKERTVSAYVKRLADKSLVSISRVAGKTLFKLFGYEEFTKETGVPLNRKAPGNKMGRSSSKPDGQGIPGYLRHKSRPDLIEPETY